MAGSSSNCRDTAATIAVPIQFVDVSKFPHWNSQSFNYQDEYSFPQMSICVFAHMLLNSPPAKTSRIIPHQFQPLSVFLDRLKYGFMCRLALLTPHFFLFNGRLEMDNALW